MYNNEFSKEATLSTKYGGYSGWVGGIKYKKMAWWLKTNTFAKCNNDHKCLLLVFYRNVIK